MTVTEFKEAMQQLESQGLGNSVIEAWDPEAEGYFPVTGYVYGGLDALVQLYTDSDEEDGYMEGKDRE